MRDERPIIFSGPMVKQILAGKKTQTRRPVKDPPKARHLYLQRMWGTSPPPDPVDFGEPGMWCIAGPDYPDDDRDLRRCPFGAEGTRLWVRENWAAEKKYDTFAPREIPHHSAIWLRAKGDLYQRGELIDIWTRREGLGIRAGRWRPSIHMPRWMSRLTLEVTEVRAQRLQEIDCYDLRAEGFDCPEHDFPGGCCISECPSLRERFVEAWNEMYRGKPELQIPANPWVWAVSFKVLL